MKKESEYAAAKDAAIRFGRQLQKALDRFPPFVGVGLAKDGSGTALYVYCKTIYRVREIAGELSECAYKRAIRVASEGGVSGCVPY